MYRSLPDIPKEIQSSFMQRVVENLNLIVGLGKDKSKQAITRRDLVKLGLVKEKDLRKL